MNAKNNRTWRGGLIGAGAWSEAQLAAWAGVAGAEIVAVCDRHPERREALARRWRIPEKFGDIETMLDRASLDFVDICTRPGSHAGLTRKAAECGLPVLCQKPFCTSFDEAREVVEFCARAGVRLMINENFRWQGWFRQAREVIAAGKLGRPFLARLLRRTRLTLPRFDHRQTYLVEMPQLIVYEMGVHWLDVMRFLFGEPQSIYARLHKASDQMRGEDVALLVLGYPHLTCTIENSWASVPIAGVDRLAAPDPGIPRLEVDGTAATLALTCDGRLQLQTEVGQEGWSFPADEAARGGTAAQRHFIDCLGCGAEFETSGRDVLKTMALVYGAYLSAAENRVVDPAELQLLHR